MKLPNALAHKGEAVEEWIDLRFFRPAGLRLARLLAPTAVTPNQVTLWAMLVGVLAGHLFYYSSRTVNLIGVALFIVSDIFDSADGQLARMRGTSSRLGRLLDGSCDSVRFISLYGHLLVRLLHAEWGWSAVLLIAIAGWSHSLQSAAIDFVRNAFLEVAGGDGGELDLPEDTAVGSGGSALARFGARLYRDYARRQAFLFPRTVRLVRALRQGQVNGDLAEAYAQRLRPVLWWCAWLGQNFRFVLLAVAAVEARAALFPWIAATALNAVLAGIILTQESQAAALLGEAGGPADGYARIR
ncbi:MAG TPA: CDP-alcohol phosphatidyltransferase family protein [Gemmatimonadales bacterium]|nr:CDP-alcohol phosphatidyltransferase family protein [Gemmatimonadales bacterium]